MEMERERQATSEDKDALIQQANKTLTRAGFEPLRHAYYLTRGEVKDAIERTKAMSNFTGRDKILLHFNRYQDMKDMRQYQEHIATHKFPTAAVARCFIEAVIRESEERVPKPTRKWHGPQRLALNDWIIITSEGTPLEDIMEEAIPKKYKLPAPYDYYANLISGYHWGNHPQISARSRGASLSEEEKQRHAPEDRSVAKKQRPQPPSERPQAARSRTAAVRQPKSSVCSLAAIAAALGHEPRVVRAALRAAKYTKPGASWDWPQEQKDKVTKDIQKLMEKQK